MILYILRRFKKLVITYFTSKNTLNLINLFLFLKKRNKVKMVNQQKLKIKNKFSHYTHASHFLAPLPHVSNQKGKRGYPPMIPI